MKKVEFLEKECICLKMINLKTTNDLDIFTYTASNLQFGRQQKNGNFKIFTEDELAKEYLESGKGVSYKGYIYFKEDKAENSKHFKLLNTKYKRAINHMNRNLEDEFHTYLNGALYDAIKEVSNFSMVKSIISLYQTGVFSMEILELKLKEYLKEENMVFVINELHHQSIEKAG